MHRRAFLATTAATALAGCVDLVGSARFGAGGDHDIGMAAHAFLPETFETTVDEPVTWVNTSSKAHTVTAFDDQLPAGAAFFATGGYDSTAEAEAAWHARFGGRLDSGGSFSHTFEVPGVYGYYCIPHLRANMVGTIVVDG